MKTLMPLLMVLSFPAQAEICEELAEVVSKIESEFAEWRGADESIYGYSSTHKLSGASECSVGTSDVLGFECIWKAHNLDQSKQLYDSLVRKIPQCRNLSIEEPSIHSSGESAPKASFKTIAFTSISFPDAGFIIDLSQDVLTHPGDGEAPYEVSIQVSGY